MKYETAIRSGMRDSGNNSSVVAVAAWQLTASHRRGNSVGSYEDTDTNAHALTDGDCQSSHPDACSDFNIHADACANKHRDADHRTDEHANADASTDQYRNRNSSADLYGDGNAHSGPSRRWAHRWRMVEIS